MKNNEIEKLINEISKLPGLGRRSAQRIALHLLNNKQRSLEPLLKSLDEACKKIINCEICNNIDTNSPCSLCSNPKRNKSTGLASLILSVIGLCNILCYELSAYLVYVNIYILKSADYILDMFNTVFKY